MSSQGPSKKRKVLSLEKSTNLGRDLVADFRITDPLSPSLSRGLGVKRKREESLSTAENRNPSPQTLLASAQEKINALVANLLNLRQLFQAALETPASRTRIHRMNRLSARTRDLKKQLSTAILEKTHLERSMLEPQSPNYLRKYGLIQAKEQLLTKSPLGLGIVSSPTVPAAPAPTSPLSDIANTSPKIS